MKHAKWLAGSALALALAWASPAVQAREMTVATYLPANSSFVTELLTPLAAWVNERANGEFTLGVYPGGTLGRDPNQQDRLVQSGIVDIAVIVPGRSPNQYPHYGIFELPGFVRTAEEGTQTVWQMHRNGVLDTGDFFQVLALWTTDPYMIHSDVPVNGIGDVSGLRVRVLGQTQTDTILAMQGVPQAVSITETPEAISRGTLDGAMADWAVFDIFRLGEVAKHSYTLPLGTLAFALVMNPQSYAELSPEGQAVLAEAGEEWQRLVTAFYTNERARIIESYTARGQTIAEASEEDIARILDLTSAMREQVRAAAGDAVMDTYIQTLEAYRAAAN